jgi:hypothetical protein
MGNTGPWQQVGEIFGGLYDRDKYEFRSFIPESTHYSEVNRLASELEARAEQEKRYEPAAIWREAASLLRDSVPASLTRGERES